MRAHQHGGDTLEAMLLLALICTLVVLLHGAFGLAAALCR